ncbi:hypothetical protein [Streptomyces hypolithicus]
MNLTDLSPLMARRRAGGLSYSYDQFRADPALAALQWPDDVQEQFLFDHGDNGAFVHDYADIDLRDVTWRLETIPAADFHGMPTGASDACCIESFAKNPVHWVAVRPPEIGRHWEEHGTWLRPPLLIDRRLWTRRTAGCRSWRAERASASCAVACARNCMSPSTTKPGSGGRDSVPCHCAYAANVRPFSRKSCG